VANSVKEEELADNECLDEHDGACCNYSNETHDVEDPNDIKYDIAWASQGFFEERHLVDEGVFEVAWIKGSSGGS